jgi:hypothetical protein
LEKEELAVAAGVLYALARGGVTDEAHMLEAIGKRRACRVLSALLNLKLVCAHRGRLRLTEQGGALLRHEDSEDL